MRRGRDAAFGNVYSFTAIVSGSKLAILFVPNRQITGTHFEVMTMPYGSDCGVGNVTSLMSPVWGFSRPAIFACCRLNQRFPFGSNRGVCGSRAAGSGIL